MSKYAIYIKKKDGGPKEALPVDLLGFSFVAVGVKSGATKIKRNEESGLNEEVDDIIGKKIYEVGSAYDSNYFPLDLETGSRGWYPGSKRIGDIINTAEIKSEPSSTSQTLWVVTDATVTILDLEYDSSSNIWYKITYNDITGYVRNTQISNIRYVDETS